MPLRYSAEAALCPPIPDLPEPKPDLILADIRRARKQRCVPYRAATHSYPWQLHFRHSQSVMQLF